MGRAQSAASFPHGIVIGRKELTVGQEISPLSQIWLLFWQQSPGCQSCCISPWESRSHPVPAPAHCECTHTLTSKAHSISLCLQDVQGNPLQLLKDWKHKKGFYKSFHHRTATALLGWLCRVKAVGHTWPQCVCECPRVVARDFKGLRNTSERALCHFKYLYVSVLSSSFPEVSVWKSIGFAFGFCLWVFLSPGEAVGGISLSPSALFLSLMPLFVIFPPHTNPREAMLIKTYIAEAYAAILFSGKTSQEHIQCLRKWTPRKSFCKCIRNQTYTISARQLCLPHLSWMSDQPRTAGVLKLQGCQLFCHLITAVQTFQWRGESWCVMRNTPWLHWKIISEVSYSVFYQPQPDGTPLFHWDYSWV